MVKSVLLVAVVGAAVFTTSRAVASRLIPKPSTRIEAPLVVTGTTMPEAVFQSQDGNPIKLSALASEDTKPLVVIAMSPGCKSCKSELPVWEELATRHRTRARFVLLVCAIDFREADEVMALAKNFERHYLCDNILRNSWGITALPAAYVVDSKAIVRLTSSGFQSVGAVDKFFGANGTDAPTSSK